MLELAIVSIPIWAYTGFNLPEGSVPLIGIQWSTFNTFAVFFYLLTVNNQVGGLESFRQLEDEMVKDLRFIWISFRHPRKGYRAEGTVDGVRGVSMAFLFCVSALFLFEVIWVPLYDYFQFGSWAWPVYEAYNQANPFLNEVFLRNNLDFILCFVLGALLLSFALDGKEFKPRFSYKLRLDWYWVAILIITICMWALWVTFQQPKTDTTALTQAQVLGPLSKSFSASNCYIFPAQQYFPQNTYTFYPCSTFGKTYPIKDILGFFNPYAWTHLINVTTKYLTFASLCYPVMFRVKRT